MVIGMMIELLVLGGSVVIDTVASNCCSAITKKKITPNIEKEMSKLGDNPTEEQILKASKKAARKCMAKRLFINSAVSAATIVGTSAVASTMISNISNDKTAVDTTTDTTSTTTDEAAATSTVEV